MPPVCSSPLARFCQWQVIVWDLGRRHCPLRAGVRRKRFLDLTLSQTVPVIKHMFEQVSTGIVGEC